MRGSFLLAALAGAFVFTFPDFAPCQGLQNSALALWLGGLAVAAQERRYRFCGGLRAAARLCDHIVMVRMSYVYPVLVETSPEAAFASEKAMARGLAEHWPKDERLDKARFFCAAVIRGYWSAEKEKREKVFRLTPAPKICTSLNSAEIGLATDLGRRLTSFPSEEARYLVGTVYTALLPADLRSALGAYYTPPCLVSRLMDSSEVAGFDWRKGSALDPACGGGAFLAPLALRMIDSLRGAEKSFVLRSVASRLSGFEIDPFAAWMSQALLEIALMDLSQAAGFRVPPLVRSLDSLRADPERQFGLVIGNPPYGRVSLETDMRERFSRSLYGHANLYGLFTDLALRWTEKGGVCAFLTPTSFLGGQYFKALRRTIAQEAPPQVLEFVEDRDGIFDDVLQETLLAVYRKGADRHDPIYVCALRPLGLSGLEVERAGEATLPDDASDVWLVPRKSGQDSLARTLREMPYRLADLGYRVSTGPLVWNRHKDQLREKSCGASVLPLVWAECVGPDGFVFRHERRNHAPFVKVEKGQDWLVFRASCVICQRTTSKEQNRRLLAAVLPSEFVARYGGVVVENHLNMIVAMAPSPSIKPETITALLSTEAVDMAYRCISGSVAVSAYELESLPLPSPSEILRLQSLLEDGAPKTRIESLARELYGLPKFRAASSRPDKKSIGKIVPGRHAQA